jgi:hypothetical protein
MPVRSAPVPGSTAAQSGTQRTQLCTRLRSTPRQEGHPLRSSHDTRGQPNFTIAMLRMCLIRAAMQWRKAQPKNHRRPEPRPIRKPILLSDCPQNILADAPDHLAGKLQQHNKPDELALDPGAFKDPESEVPLNLAQSLHKGAGWDNRDSNFLWPWLQIRLRAFVF